MNYIKKINDNIDAMNKDANFDTFIADFNFSIF